VGCGVGCRQKEKKRETPASRTHRPPRQRVSRDVCACRSIVDAMCSRNLFLSRPSPPPPLLGENKKEKWHVCFSFSRASRASCREVRQPEERGAEASRGIHHHLFFIRLGIFGACVCVYFFFLAQRSLSLSLSLFWLAVIMRADGRVHGEKTIYDLVFVGIAS
jgi:hypothetical protein